MVTVPSVPGDVSEENLPAVTVIDETGSTNDDVRELGRGTAPEGTAVSARVQTAGRGRRGHVWESPSGGLYLSVLLRPKVPQQQLMGLAAVCALGVLDALQAVGAAHAALKWPNDVVASSDPQAGKLAGILMEAGVGDGGVFAVCGVGVNLAKVDDGLSGFDSTRALAPAFLWDLLPADSQRPTFEELSTALRDAIVGRCRAWEADVKAGHAMAGPLAPILSEYFDKVPLLGHPVEAVRPDGNTYLRGVFAGVDVWGRATVHLEDGHDVDLSSEQVSIRAL